MMSPQDHPGHIRVKHLRYADGPLGQIAMPVNDLRRIGHAPQSKGGITIATIELSSGKRFVGIARCSKLDNYCKETGRQIAVGRALKIAWAGI
jgi:hypothetical protein